MIADCEKILKNEINIQKPIQKKKVKLLRSKQNDGSAKSRIEIINKIALFA
jgi:hypothetical protein